MSTATNLLSALIAIIGYFWPVWHGMIFDVGIFALCGAITTWIAIYMLFDKVPFLYGSGAIPMRFEEFKAGMKHLIVQEFFTREHIERFFNQNGLSSLEKLSANIDFDRVFEHLVDAITDSPLGGFLKMAGGRKALDPLKEPIILKLKEVIADLAQSSVAGEGGKSFTDTLIEQVEHIIDSRLAELTPQKVKEIVETMIRKHLGWLVMWGGVFGGLMGIADNILKYYG